MRCLPQTLVSRSSEVLLLVFFLHFCLFNGVCFHYFQLFVIFPFFFFKRSDSSGICSFRWFALSIFPYEHGTFFHAKFHPCLFLLFISRSLILFHFIYLFFFANSLMLSIYIKILIFSRDSVNLWLPEHFVNMLLSGIMAITNCHRFRLCLFGFSPLPMFFPPAVNSTFQFLWLLRWILRFFRISCTFSVFFCHIIFACRRFLICISSQISHPGFEFLFVFFQGTPIFSQTNFAPA